MKGGKRRKQKSKDRNKINKKTMQTCNNNLCSEKMKAKMKRSWRADTFERYLKTGIMEITRNVTNTDKSKQHKKESQEGRETCESGGESRINRWYRRRGSRGGWRLMRSGWVGGCETDVGEGEELGWKPNETLCSLFLLREQYLLLLAWQLPAQLNQPKKRKKKVKRMMKRWQLLFVVIHTFLPKTNWSKHFGDPKTKTRIKMLPTRTISFGTHNLFQNWVCSMFFACFVSSLYPLFVWLFAFHLCLYAGEKGAAAGEKGVSEEQGPLDVEKKVSDIRPIPLTLPAGFEWSDCDMTDAKTVSISLDEDSFLLLIDLFFCLCFRHLDQLDEVYNLLASNYVEDDDSMFRFAYPQQFLQWSLFSFSLILSVFILVVHFFRALLVPGYRPDWHVGVRVSANRKLVGFITGIPVHIHVYDKEADMAEINFLCVHKKLRAQRLAPVLIKEITRRVNLTEVWQVSHTWNEKGKLPNENVILYCSGCIYCWRRSAEASEFVSLLAPLLEPKKVDWCELLPSQPSHVSRHNPQVLQIASCICLSFLILPFSWWCRLFFSRLLSPLVFVFLLLLMSLPAPQCWTTTCQSLTSVFISRRPTLHTGSFLEKISSILGSLRWVRFSLFLAFRSQAFALPLTVGSRHSDSYWHDLLLLLTFLHHW